MLDFITNILYGLPFLLLVVVTLKIKALTDVQNRVSAADMVFPIIPRIDLFSLVIVILVDWARRLTFRNMS